jgi:hypothetical protein
MRQRIGIGLFFLSVLSVIASSAAGSARAGRAANKAKELAESAPPPTSAPGAICQDPTLQGTCARMNSFMALAVSLAARGERAAVDAAQKQCQEFLAEYKGLVDLAHGLSRAPQGDGVEGLSSAQFTMLGPDLRHGKAFCESLLRPGTPLKYGVCSSVVPIGDGISYGAALERAWAALHIAPSVRPCNTDVGSEPLVQTEEEPGPQESGGVAAPVAPTTAVPKPSTPGGSLTPTAKTSAATGEKRPPWRRPVRIAMATGLSAVALGLLIAGGMDMTQAHGIERDTRAAQSGLTPRQFETESGRYNAAYLKGGLELGFAGIAIAGAGVVLGVDFTKSF